LAEIANHCQAELANPFKTAVGRISYAENMAKNDTPAPNRIRELRLARGLTLEQLAALTPHPDAGKSTDLTQIGRLERGGQKLTTDWMDRVAAGLGVSPTELLAPTDYPPARRVPLIGVIAAGNWREAIEDAIDLIPTTKGGPHTFALKPAGDSMDKVLVGDPVIFVDPDDIELRDTKLYAVMNSDGETTFKKFRTDPMRFEPCSSNPAHKTFLVGAEPFVIVGRVVGQESDL
jgi:repressor LexA